MSVLPGFGVVYKGQQSSWAYAKAFFKSIKNSSKKFGIRPATVYSPVPWVVGDPTVPNSNAYWRACAQYFASDPDFYVTWGIAGDLDFLVPQGLTLTTWANYRNVVLAEAAYLQSQGIVLGDFEIGNELESHVDNVTVTINSLSVLIGQLATDVKAVYNLSPISYAATNGGTMFTSFVANGKGGLDWISYHTYGQYNFNPAFNRNYYYPSLGSFGSTFPYARSTGFPNNSYMSEFNVTSNNIAITYLRNEDVLALLPQIITAIQTGQFKAPPYFMWYEFVDDFTPTTPVNLSDNGFTMVHRDGRTIPWWNLFFTKQPKMYTPRGASTNRPQGNGRPSISRPSNVTRTLIN